MVTSGQRTLFQTFFTFICIGCIASGAYLLREHVDEAKAMFVQADSPIDFMKNTFRRAGSTLKRR